MIRTTAVLASLVLGALLVAFQGTNIASGGTLSSNCRVGDLFIKTGASAGLYTCLTANTWTGPLASGGSGDVTAAANIADNAIVRGDGGTKGVQQSGITIDDSNVIAFPDGVKQTFNPNGTNAGFNAGSQAGDPSTLGNGDLWYDSTNNTLDARINGSTVSLGAGGGGCTIVRKTSDETVSNTTYQDDDALIASIGSTETRLIDWVIFYNAATTADIKIAFSGPSGVTGRWGHHGLETSAGSFFGDLSAVSSTGFTDAGNALGGGGATDVMMRFGMNVSTSGTSGNITFRWARNAGSGDVIVRSGSYLSSCPA